MKLNQNVTLFMRNQMFISKKIHINKIYTLEMTAQKRNRIYTADQNPLGSNQNNIF